LKVLVNHIGYNSSGTKYAVIELDDNKDFKEASVIAKDDGKAVFSGDIKIAGSVPGWKKRTFAIFDFSEYSGEGRFYIEVLHNGLRSVSEIFELSENILIENTLSDILYYFKTVRCTDQYERYDYSVSVFGNEDIKKDVHGGWYDASGDYSKYLSHLSYANYMNPQQSPLMVWLLMDSYENIKGIKDYGSEYKERFLSEALHGADFLVRMQDESGFFYMILFDKWSKKLDERMLCSYTTQKGIRNTNYKSGYRQGGGLAIAALARMSAYKKAGDYSPSEYLQAAETGFNHLEKNNLSYLNDGKENIIDDYSALMAATELYNATGSDKYRISAEKRVNNLIKRLSSDDNYSGWLRADDKGEIPFFHSSDAGLPVIALVRYLDVIKEKNVEITGFIEKYLTFEMELTEEIINPFGYARQYVKALDSPPRSSFFIPHNNWSGYWWQGENSRLASIATASMKAFPVLSNSVFKEKLVIYSQRQINWILGLNPFNICMLNGKGANNINYDRTWRNAGGGIVNGVTGGFSDENDIAFMPEKKKDDPNHSWRWSEQWLIHSAWYMSAICSFELIHKNEIVRDV